MKKEILMLIIGILIGAIITTGVFLVLKGDSGEKNRMNMGEPPTMDGNSINGGREPLRTQENIEQSNSEETSNTADEQE